MTKSAALSNLNCEMFTWLRFDVLDLVGQTSLVVGWEVKVIPSHWTSAVFIDVIRVIVFAGRLPVDSDGNFEVFNGWDDGHFDMLATTAWLVMTDPWRLARMGDALDRVLW
jgi:hypothetical protein